jgi:hypothetical protein
MCALATPQHDTPAARDAFELVRGQMDPQTIAAVTFDFLVEDRLAVVEPRAQRAVVGRQDELRP